MVSQIVVADSRMPVDDLCCPIDLFFGYLEGDKRGFVPQSLGVEDSGSLPDDLIVFQLLYEINDLPGFRSHLCGDIVKRFFCHRKGILHLVE